MSDFDPTNLGVNNNDLSDETDINDIIDALVDAFDTTDTRLITQETNQNLANRWAISDTIVNETIDSVDVSDYSSKAYANESKSWATGIAGSSVTADGVTTIDGSAREYYVDSESSKTQAEGYASTATTAKEDAYDYKEDAIDAQEAAEQAEANITAAAATLADIVAAVEDVGTPLSIYVDGATGNDTTGDGTESLPYATISKAIEVGLNSFSNVVYIEIDPGSSYTISFTEELYSTSQRKIVLRGSLSVGASPDVAISYLGTDYAFSVENCTLGFVNIYLTCDTGNASSGVSVTANGCFEYAYSQIDDAHTGVYLENSKMYQADNGLSGTPSAHLTIDSCTARGVYATVSDVSLEYVDVIGASSIYAGAYMITSTLYMDTCSITGEFSYGVYLTSGSKASLDTVTVDGGAGTDISYGVCTVYASTSHLISCSITNIASRGVYTTYASETFAYSCTISSSSIGYNAEGGAKIMVLGGSVTASDTYSPNQNGDVSSPVYGNYGSVIFKA